MTKKYHPGQIFIFNKSSYCVLILSIKKFDYRSRYITKSLMIKHNKIEYLRVNFWPEYDEIIV